MYLCRGKREVVRPAAPAAVLVWPALLPRSPAVLLSRPACCSLPPALCYRACRCCPSSPAPCPENSILSFDPVPVPAARPAVSIVAHTSAYVSTSAALVRRLSQQERCPDSRHPDKRRVFRFGTPLPAPFWGEESNHSPLI